jgi:hypothetical protein
MLRGSVRDLDVSVKLILLTSRELAMRGGKYFNQRPVTYSARRHIL